MDNMENPNSQSEMTQPAGLQPTGFQPSDLQSTNLQPTDLQSNGLQMKAPEKTTAQDADSDDSVFHVFGNAKTVEFDQKLASQQINMNPTEKMVVEPLTGSSVVYDASSEQGVPENGFPAGYGPNAGIKRIEKPVKPKLKERIKRSFGQMTKKQRRLLVIIPSISLILIITLSLVAMVTGVFATDYCFCIRSYDCKYRRFASSRIYRLCCT